MQIQFQIQKGDKKSDSKKRVSSSSGQKVKEVLSRGQCYTSSLRDNSTDIRIIEPKLRQSNLSQQNQPKTLLVRDNRF